MGILLAWCKVCVKTLSAPGRPVPLPSDCLGSVKAGAQKPRRAPCPKDKGPSSQRATEVPSVVGRTCPVPMAVSFGRFASRFCSSFHGTGIDARFSQWYEGHAGADLSGAPFTAYGLAVNTAITPGLDLPCRVFTQQAVEYSRVFVARNDGRPASSNRHSDCHLACRACVRHQ